MMTPAVEAEHLTRRFGDVTALDGVALTIRRGEFFSLLGPSGCGKTTLLRIVAGLDFPESGALRLNGREALAIPAHRRPVNTVFQSYALFPHLTVEENIAFGLRMKKFLRHEIDTRTRGAMELTQIAELAHRRPAQLSGGQKQRVALARALVNSPEVLLLDEPLGALDLKLRKQLQQELRSLQRRTGVTFIHVTHDQDEALAMSDRMAVMEAGRIAQLGTGAELYERPRNRFVAQFLGGCNLLRATILRHEADGIMVRSPVGELRVATEHQRASWVGGRTDCTLALRPENICLVAPSEPHTCQGEVIETTYTGAETHSLVRTGEETLRVVSVNSAWGTRVVCGDQVHLRIPAEALVVLED